MEFVPSTGSVTLIVLASTTVRPASAIVNSEAMIFPWNAIPLAYP
jgi:hypothetical protein